MTETYEEVEVVEAERESIEDYLEQAGEKRRTLLFTKPKEEKAPDYEGMAKMMQKLSNKIRLRKGKRSTKVFQAIL